MLRVYALVIGALLCVIGGPIVAGEEQQQQEQMMKCVGRAFLYCWVARHGQVLLLVLKDDCSEATQINGKFACLLVARSNSATAAPATEHKAA